MNSNIILEGGKMNKFRSLMILFGLVSLVVFSFACTSDTASDTVSSDGNTLKRFLIGEYLSVELMII